jgi:hypothetical protein
MDVIRQVAQHGTSAHRQVEIFDRTGGDMRAVCDWLMSETMKGI